MPTTDRLGWSALIRKRGQPLNPGRAGKQRASRAPWSRRRRDVELVKVRAAERAACHVRGRESHDGCQDATGVIPLDHAAAPNRRPDAALGVNGQAVGHHLTGTEPDERMAFAYLAG